LDGQPLIELDRVEKRFPGASEPAVREVSFQVPKGALVALVGGSGSGKTTTLKCINRLVEPDRGEIRIEGRRNDAVDAVSLRRGIGYAFQNVGLFPHLTVGENIGVTPRLQGRPAAEIAARVQELLALVALPAAFADRFPDALSGGQRQRVGVARALAANPRIVLMDEPFGALDPLTREDLGLAYRALHEKLGLTTVMVTHDVQEAVLMADRIVVMRDGRVVADDAPGALLAGHPDPDVAALMASPRRQAERVQALLDRASEAGRR
jgi:osmoprotectant transport system ATP-binding protein